ncbi:hypothetical protein [Gynuella sp.]|uniref:hypothetical protein n=1 Tax=Gynuella sp. TaxID=2969146 RepID=UPI003D0A036C
MSDYKSLSEIMDELRNLADQKATGSLFIVSDERHSASFGLEKGRIVALQCRGRFGAQAMTLVSRIKQGTSRFELSSNYLRKMDLPDNEEVIRQILDAQSSAPAAAPGTARSATPTPPPMPASAPRALNISASQKAAIEDVLVDSLGPMGSIVMDSIEDCKDMSSIVMAIKEVVETPEIVQSLVGKIKDILTGK